MTAKIRELINNMRALREAATKGPFKIIYESETDKKTGETKLTGRATLKQDFQGGVLISYTTNRDAEFHAASPENQKRMEAALLVAVEALEKKSAETISEGYPCPGDHSAWYSGHQGVAGPGTCPECGLDDDSEAPTRYRNIPDPKMKWGRDLLVTIEAALKGEK